MWELYKMLTMAKPFITMKIFALMLTLSFILSQAIADPQCFVSCKHICAISKSQAALLCPMCKCCPQITCRYCMFGYVLARDSTGCRSCRCKWPM
ncbi:Hypothetical predicted protein [Mytilus galloprovincialis]|nr:Hypothetical predicted protein [Mytilus galloprovincialis]